VDCYFETSAIVKLILKEAGSEEAAVLWTRSTRLATSLLSYTETRAAIASARRGGRLSSGGALLARKSLDQRFLGMDYIDVTEATVRRAGDLADKHALRGFDAVHVASAAEIGRGTIVVTWDRDVALAAQREGLQVAGVRL
jgi:predicted nucleic acid-binding protein